MYMKFTGFITAALIGSICLTTSAFIVNAEEINDTEQFVGFYLNSCLDAVGFDSWANYLTYSYEANITVKGDDYIDNYDYIYLPSSLTDKTDSITSVFLTPTYCETKFDIDGSEIDFKHYFSSDRQDHCYYYSDFAEIFGSKRTVDGVDVYRFSGEDYFKWDGCYFSVSGLDTDKLTISKVYIDSHFQEHDGELYYINDNGDKEIGVKSINGHQYYFRHKYGAAVRDKLAYIGGYAYIFDRNGICCGKYTGYAISSGERVYFSNGVITEN